MKNATYQYHSVESSDYIAIEHIFNRLIKTTSSDFIVDVGSGTGRVIEWLCKNVEYNKIIGYEIEPVAVQISNGRLADKRDVLIVNNDIFDCFPYGVNIFYLYNPFPAKSAVKFVEYLNERYNHGLIIIYYNPVFLFVFEDHKIYEIQEFEIEDGIPWVAVIHKKNTITV